MLCFREWEMIVFSAKAHILLRMSGRHGILDFLRRHASRRRELQLLLVCGPWGSGTSAVAGMVASLGAQSSGPYFATKDPKTPISYEFIPFRSWVLRCASEKTLTLKPGADAEAVIHLRRLRTGIERSEFGRYDPAAPIVLKHPLSALLLPHICAVFSTRLIYVIRPLEEIERTRVRRKWPVHLGRSGAEGIYRAMEDFARTQPRPILTLKFDELRAAPDEQARKLADFGGLRPDAAAFQKAVAFIRREES
jgi:hypothetical protein